MQANQIPSSPPSKPSPLALAKRRPPVRREQATAIPPTAVVPRSGKSRDWFSFGLGLSCVAALSVTAGALGALLLAGTPFAKGEASLPPGEAPIAKHSLLPIPQLSRPVNVLVVGTKVLTSDIGRSPDAGYHELVNAFTGLADTIMLLRFDPDTKAVTALSIPRDTRVFLPRYGEIKINATNQRGGPTLTAEAVQALLSPDVPIDRYVRVNVQGVERLIDALGGVELYVPKDMKYQDDSQHLYINLKEGLQHLDGDEALQFLRFRHDGLGDIGRVQRQQLLLRATVEQALKPQILGRLPKIFDAIGSNVDTNLSVEEMLALSGFATHVRSNGDLQMLMLPGSFGNARDGTASYWLPDSDRIERLAQQHFTLDGLSDATSSTALTSLRIAIQDSSDRPEAARELARQLQAQGYRNVTLARAWPEPLGTTRILAQRGDVNAARQIQTQIDGSEVRIESTGVLGSDLTIVLGRDWLSR